jgi:hypothetical protein
VFYPYQPLLPKQALHSTLGTISVTKLTAF